MKWENQVEGEDQSQGGGEGGKEEGGLVPSSRRDQGRPRRCWLCVVELRAVEEEEGGEEAEGGGSRARR